MSDIMDANREAVSEWDKFEAADARIKMLADFTDWLRYEHNVQIEKSWELILEYCGVDNEKMFHQLDDLLLDVAKKVTPNE